MNRYVMPIIFVMFSVICAPLFAELRGKIDVGATIMEIDILESGKTVKTLHMQGAKAEATVLIYQGLCIKAGGLWGEKHGILRSGSAAVGYYIPLTKKFKILPNVGMTWTYLRFGIDKEELMLFDLKERFRSRSPFIAMEFAYCFAEKWTLVGLYQYAWSHTSTKIRAPELGTIVNDKSHSDGPNYAIGLDYSLNKNWSISLGAGYNITLSHEKHGIRGKGVKLGLAYYF